MYEYYPYSIRYTRYSTKQLAHTGCSNNIALTKALWDTADQFSVLFCCKHRLHRTQAVFEKSSGHKRSVNKNFGELNFRKFNNVNQLFYIMIQTSKFQNSVKRRKSSRVKFYVVLLMLD